MNKINSKENRSWFKGLCWALFVFSCPSWGSEKAPSLAVLYPEYSKQSYKLIFNTIVEGIERGFKKASDGKDAIVLRFELDEMVSSEQLHDRLQKERVDVTVALGNKGLNVVEGMPPLSPVLFGAVNSLDENKACGITMVPPAGLVLKTLRSMTSKVNDVHIVYDQEKQADIFSEAKSVGALYDLEVHGYPVDNLGEAIRAYQSIIDSDNPETQSIWLISNKSVIDQDILTDVLKKAWAKNVVVFSSVATHVQRGALFALYPDYAGMGERLGEMAYLAMNSSEGCKVEPVVNVHIAINWRTSDHLGLNPSKEIRDKILMEFPAN
ncbi:hypothetical protein QP938_08355 [Porticoccaceae bacterium LTM1]|nr:hypothetical protein QP938_08355 [Porticoccaceae bacterium LTM1]